VTPGGQIFLIDHADLPLKTVRARGAHSCLPGRYCRRVEGRHRACSRRRRHRTGPRRSGGAV